MIKTVVCCDLCGITLPTEEVDSPFGKIEIVKTSKVEIWDVSNVFPHLCRGCALEIQYSLKQLKLDLLFAESGGKV